MWNNCTSLAPGEFKPIVLQMQIFCVFDTNPDKELEILNFGLEVHVMNVLL